MEEVMLALQKIQNELDEQKKTILKNGEDVTTNITKNINIILEEKFKTWEVKHNYLKEKVENQEKRLYFLEKQARQRNIVLFGLEEKESSYSDLENSIINFIDKHFRIKLEKRDLQAITRIGKKGERPRPITVTFTTLGMKIGIFKQKSLLNNTEYYIKEDYPKNILEKRKELQERVKLEKEKGNKAIIKYDKLIVLENKSDTSSKKRMLSVSPEINQLNPHKVADRRPQEKRKNNPKSAYSSLQRSSSITEGVLKPSMLNYLVNKNTNNPPNQQDNHDQNSV